MRRPRSTSIISSRRGQILGFDARPGWPGWDVVEAHIPEAEIQNLIVELRSATAGVGTFNAKFDHLAELTGKIADQVLASRAPKPPRRGLSRVQTLQPPSGPIRSARLGSGQRD